MKRILFTVCFLLINWDCFATDSYSIYLVRHAEKLTDSKNPALTECGQTRANQLASLLSKANITSIYSTSYQRTMQTAKPLAKLQKLAIKNYNPRYLEQLSLQLQQQAENTLVVGHSNTTPILAALLAKQKVAPLTEDDFQYLYQVQLSNDQVVLTILQQPLSCSVPSTSN